MTDALPTADQLPATVREGLARLAADAVPTMLFGCKPSEAVAASLPIGRSGLSIAGAMSCASTDWFLGGAASFPVLWTEIRKHEFEQKRLRAWLGYLLEFLQQQYGVSLHYVLHTDEPYPHVHWGAVPELEANRQMLIAALHPGHAAYDRVRAKSKNNSMGRAAYQRAMRSAAGRYPHRGLRPAGIARVGPRRQRLSRSERNARKQADMALARTLATKREIKAKWHQEIRAEISGEFSERADSDCM